ncbi:hypothetical protein HWV62_34131 [Athelia sp. TMB]|nr:hypothetical protein HWV62_34131 [Athelia sp. TMB]
MPTTLRTEEEYFLLPGENDAEKAPIVVRSSRRRHWAINFLSLCSLLLNVVAVLYFFASRAPQGSKYVLWKGDSQVWSPAQDSVGHKNQLGATFLQRSKYSGPPSPEVDQAWRELYHRYVMSAIPEEQASKLSNETMRVPGPGHPRYIVGLDVFHQLHCLDYLRQNLYPDYYGHHHDHGGVIAPPEGPDDEPFDHLDHCINNVRSALMKV